MTDIGRASQALACPACGGPLERVIDSRGRHGYIRRRRACTVCGTRATTMERIGRPPYTALPASEVLERAVAWIEAQRCPYHNPDNRKRWGRRKDALLRLLNENAERAEAA